MVHVLFQRYAGRHEYNRFVRNGVFEYADDHDHMQGRVFLQLYFCSAEQTGERKRA